MARFSASASADNSLANFAGHLIWSDNPENHQKGRFKRVDGAFVEVPSEIGIQANDSPEVRSPIVLSATD